MNPPEETWEEDLRLESKSDFGMAGNGVQLGLVSMPVGWRCTYSLQFSIETAAGVIKTGKMTPWFQEGYCEHNQTHHSAF